MRSFLIAIISFFILSCLAFSDEFLIPFECYPKQIQSDFAKYGKKVDLDGSDRSEDSFGFIMNLGTNYKIITYKSATPEEMALIIAVAQGRPYIDNSNLTQEGVDE